MMIKTNRIPKGLRERLLGLLLLALTLGVYGQAIDFDFILFDDPGYVLDNDHVRAGLTWSGFIWAFTTFTVSNWHPLTWLSHMLDVQLFGLDPAGHHLMNVILHAVNALLLFLFLRETTDYPFRSFIVAALFALHPLHIESVAWISERKDLLCAFFWMLTILSHARYAKSFRKSWYTASLIFFMLGLISKPMIVTLPFVLILLDFWPLGRFFPAVVDHPVASHPSDSVHFIPPVSLKKLLYEKIPFFILSLLSSMVTFVAQREGGAVQSLEMLPFQSRIVNALYSYFFYIKKMFWPLDLSIYYPHLEKTLNIHVGAAFFLVLSAVSVLTIRLIPRKPYLAVGWFWFLGTLAPVIGIVQVGGQGMADRYTYIPLTGLFVVLVWALSEWISEKKISLTLQFCLTSAVILLLLAMTGSQLAHWRNTLTLFRHALAVNPDNVEALYMLAVQEEQQGHHDAYHDYYRKAVSINPGFVAIRHNRIGHFLVKNGKYDEAIRQFEHALEVRPDYLSARINLGVAYAEKGEFHTAATILLPLWRKRPRDRPLQESLFNVMRRLALTREPVSNGNP